MDTTAQPAPSTPTTVPVTIPITTTRTPTFVYWGVKARLQLSVLICDYAGLPYNWDRNPDWPAFKPNTVFGQLPYMEEGSMRLCQSMAIARLMSRRAHLQGDSEEDFALSEQLIEEQSDIYAVLLKAQYSPTKQIAFKKALEEDIPRHFTCLERLLTQSPSNGQFFGTKLTAGDLAIFSIVNIVLDVDTHALDKFGKLRAFYSKIEAFPQFKRYLANPPGIYFKKD